MGRPSSFSQKVASELCDKIATTPKGLYFICGTHESFPDPKTVNQWLRDIPEFLPMYARAKELQADLLFEECLDIADETDHDTLTLTKRDGSEYDVPDNEWITRSKVRIETRRWMVAKLAPKKYGEKTEVTHEAGDTLTQFLDKVRKS